MTGHFNQNGGVLVATDAALQGIELSQVKHVIYYDLPSDPTHWRSGEAVSIVLVGFRTALSISFRTGQGRWLQNPRRQRF